MSLPDSPYNNELSEDISAKVADITKQIWRQWKKEYLLELRESHRQAPKKNKCGTIAVGDVVLVHDDNQPRGCWKLAKVESLIKGTDGLIRSAKLEFISLTNGLLY